MKKLFFVLVVVMAFVAFVDMPLTVPLPTVVVR